MGCLATDRLLPVLAMASAQPPEFASVPTVTTALIVRWFAQVEQQPLAVGKDSATGQACASAAMATLVRTALPSAQGHKTFHVAITVFALSLESVNATPMPRSDFGQAATAPLAVRSTEVPDVLFRVLWIGGSFKMQCACAVRDLLVMIVAFSARLG